MSAPAPRYARRVGPSTGPPLVDPRSVLDSVMDSLSITRPKSYVGYGWPKATVLRTFRWEVTL